MVSKVFLVAQAIDLIQAFAGGSAGEEQGSASEHADADALRLWMKRHRAAVLQDACTKQYDSAVEAARQFGHGELKEVFTAEERKRSRLDGGFEEDGRQRDDAEIVAAPEPAHVLRERDMAMAQARAMRHPYRAMPLTGAPPARFPLYLSPRWFCRFPTLDENGHAPETLDPGEERDPATEGRDRYETGWSDPQDLYITSSDGSVAGFRKPNGNMATTDELRQDARRWSFNFAVDVRFCHTYNHAHECKPTCFKNSEHKKPSTDAAVAANKAPRSACRFRFWRIVLIGLRLLRRMGEALVPEPYVAATADENNEYGRCKVRRQNCFRGAVISHRKKLCWRVARRPIQPHSFILGSIIKHICHYSAIHHSFGACYAFGYLQNLPVTGR